MKNIICILIMIVIVSCSYRQCYENSQEFKKEEHHFILLSKEDSLRYNIFNGISRENKKIRWYFIGHHDIYESAEKGDSILKDTGNTSIFLWKYKLNEKIEFQYVCGQVLYR